MKIVVRRSSILVFANELPFSILQALNTPEAGNTTETISISTSLTDDELLTGKKYFIKACSSKNDTFFVLPRSILPELMKVVSGDEVEYSEAPVFNPIRETTIYPIKMTYNDHQKQLLKIISNTAAPHAVTLANQSGTDKYPMSLHAATSFSCPILIVTSNIAETKKWCNEYIRELNVPMADICVLNSITDVRAVHQSKELFPVYILNLSIVSKKSVTQAELNILWNVIGTAGIGVKIVNVTSASSPMDIFWLDAYTKIFHTIYLKSSAYIKAENERIYQYLIPKEGSSSALVQNIEKKNRSIIFSVLDTNPEQTINRRVCNMGEVNMDAYAEYISSADVSELYAAQIIQNIETYRAYNEENPKIAVVCPSEEAATILHSIVNNTEYLANFVTKDTFIEDTINYYHVVINLCPCSYGKTFLDIFNRVYARQSKDCQLIYFVDYKMSSIQNFAKECVTRLQMFPNEFTRIFCNLNGVNAPDLRSALTFIV